MLTYCLGILLACQIIFQKGLLFRLAISLCTKDKRRAIVLPPNLICKKKTCQMKTTYLFIITLFLISVLFLLNALAQNYSQWGLPEGATARIGKGTVTDIAYSPDGSQLAVASLIGIWIYDARTGKELDLLTRHSPIYSIAYSPDGRTLAAADMLNVFLWDTDTRKYKTALIAATKDMFFTINSIAYSPDGTTLATAGGTEAYLWDANTGEHEVTLIEHAHGIHSLMYSPDGKTLATTTGDYTVLLWDTDTRKRKATLRGHTNSINSVAYSPEGETIATASSDHTVRLWNASTGKNKKKLEDHAGWALSVTYSPDGTTLATAIGSKGQLWDANTGENKITLKGHLFGSWGYIYSVVYSPDGKTIATASKGEVRFWDAETGKNTGTLKGHMGPADFVTYSPDGKTIATAIGSPHHRRKDEIIFLWNAITGVHKEDCKNSKKEVFGFVKSLTYSPDGKTIATAIGNEVHFWNAETGKQHETILKGDTNWISSAAYSPDGKTIATAVESNILLWDTDTGKLKSTTDDWMKGWLPHTTVVVFVIYSPDGKTIASASGNEVNLWDVRTAKYKNTLKGHTDRISAVEYSPDGKTIITMSDVGEGEVRLWNADIGIQKSALKGYTSLVYSPDGSTITTSSNTGKVHLWDAGMRKYKTILEHHSRSSRPVYSPDGGTLATASYDGTIFLWDTRDLATQISQQSPMPTQEVVGSQSPQQIAKSALASTVLIVVEDANGHLLRTGSGFFVENGMIATNLHVVEGVFKGYVKRVGMDRMYRVEDIVAMDSRQDLAIIKVSDISAPILPIGRSDKVQVGESVYVAGNPIGFLEGTFSNGIVSGVREFRVDSKRIQITAPISEGSSGGPVLNSKGEVIGVAVSTITMGQNLNFAIPSNYLRVLLNKVKVRK